ncbi:hypothetical protein [Nocardia sp. NPDC057030]
MSLLRVELTDQHTNRAMLVDGPDIVTRAVDARRTVRGDAQ